MDDNRLVISPAAKRDLHHIYRFGLQCWGKPQAERYLNSIQDQLTYLLDNPELGNQRNDILPELRSLPVKSHIIFYRTKDLATEIIRVLHSRQDARRIY